MFENPAKPEVLIFASENMASACEQKLNGQVACYLTDSIDEAKEILFNHDISVVLCDVTCGIKDAEVRVLNAEDINSVGQAEQADEIFEKFVADRLASLYHGGSFANIPEEHLSVSGFMSYPKYVEAFQDILQDPVKAAALYDEIKENEKLLEKYPPRTRYREGWLPDFVGFLTKQFTKEPIAFKEADPYILPREKYVSEERIRNTLVKGGNVYEGKYRIYSFFLNNKDAQARIDFLKDEYGTGGSSSDRNDESHDFLTYVLEKYSLPVYILQAKDDDISQEEFLSFAKISVRDVLTVKARNNVFAKQVVAKCKIAYQQGNMMKLARENKVLSYKTSQTISKNKKTATINLFDFRLSLITDVDDSKSILDNVSRPNLHFEDVIGAEDAKQELKYFVEYLKNPVKYMRKGVRSPKGVLLYGPPGTGKTLLAKAMAGESGVTFLKAEGNEFLKRYVGEGSEAVHSLFNSARKYAPAIVFVDEIDAIGKDRNMLGSEDHTSDVLTAFLTEMDGFNTDTSKPVFVLAATNYGVDSEKGKSLDAALLRRFDRRIYVDLPNKDLFHVVISVQGSA